MSNSDNKKTIKTALYNTIANLISLVVGIVMIPIISRVIPAKDIGIASSFVSTKNCFVIIATLAAYAYVNKAMLEFKEEKESYIYSICVFCTVVLAGLFVIALPFKGYIQQILSLDDFLFYWLFVSSFVFCIFIVGDYYCIFHNKYKLLFLLTISVGPLSQFLSVGLASVMGTQKYIGRVIGLDFTYCIVAVCVFIWLARAKKKFSMKYVKATLLFTVPIIPHLLSQTFLTQCDLVMIQYYTDAEKTGIYSMAHTLGFLAFTVMTQIMAAWSPWVYRRIEDKQEGTVKKNSGLVVLLGGYISIGLLSVSPELIKIFLTDTYLPCIYIVPPLVVAMFLQFIYLFMYDLGYYHKRAKQIAIASVIAAVSNFLLNMICIPRFGYMAACYTTVASYFILLAINCVFCARLGVKKIYDIKSMIITTSVVTVYMIFSMFFAEQLLIRYAALILITVLLILWKYKEMLAFVRVLRGEQ